MTVALVTGASRGIGRATALALADAGFSLGLVARDPAGLAETENLARERGADAASVTADVREPQEVAEAVASIEATVGSVAVLVNNAGTLHAIGPMWEVDPNDWWSDVETSLGGAFNLCRALVPRMIGRARGRIVNVTSYVATRPTPYQTGYAAGKAAVCSLTEALAASLAEYGIFAFAVAPGFTDTEMTRRLMQSDVGRRWLPEAGKGRVVSADRTARLIAQLACGAGNALSGRLLHALDDVDALTARMDEIRRDDLYALRLRRLPEA